MYVRNAGITNWVREPTPLTRDAEANEDNPIS